MEIHLILYGLDSVHFKMTWLGKIFRHPCPFERTHAIIIALRQRTYRIKIEMSEWIKGKTSQRINGKISQTMSEWTNQE